MNLMLFGAPGAGKGTQAKFLIEKYNIPQISTGDILRAAIADKTDMGMEAKKFMDEGKLVPDSTIIGIIRDRLAESDCKKGFILDGFPRTIHQAEELKELLVKLDITLDMAINIDVPREVILDRLCTRRTCENPDCQAIYNVKSNPPKQEGICDKCSSPVIQRDDETEEAISHRLQTYNDKTAPLIGFYEKEGLLKTVVGTSSDVVVKEIKTALGL